MYPPSTRRVPHVPAGDPRGVTVLERLPCLLVISVGVTGDGRSVRRDHAHCSTDQATVGDCFMRVWAWRLRVGGAPGRAQPT
jgi:hypothetical protein